MKLLTCAQLCCVVMGPFGFSEIVTTRGHLRCGGRSREARTDVLLPTLNQKKHGNNGALGDLLLEAAGFPFGEEEDCYAHAY